MGFSILNAILSGNAENYINHPILRNLIIKLGADIFCLCQLFQIVRKSHATKFITNEEIGSLL